MFSGVRNAVENAVQDLTDRFDQTRQRRGQNRRPSRPRDPQQPPLPPPPRTQPTPSASIKAIRQLPMIRVAPEDLVDENNRECCICLEDNKLDEKVVRLPCAHIFHASCIIDWLGNHSCTCPVCRYELPTDDPRYEAGRKERMKTRKPRYAMHELNRMAVSELLALRRRPASGVIDKKELIQDLVDEDWIDIIPSPEPVEYELEVLKNMKIGQLKRSMEEAGVFFRREDVVEKSDMISVFENSGRLILKKSPEPKAEEDCVIVETPEDDLLNGNEGSVTDNGAIAIDDKTGDCIIVETAEDDPFNAEDGSVDDGTTTTDDKTGDYVIVEPAGDDPSNSHARGDSNETADETRPGSPIVMFPDQDEEGDEVKREHSITAAPNDSVARNSIVENSSSPQMQSANSDLSDRHEIASGTTNLIAAEMPIEQQPMTHNASIDNTSELDANESHSAVGSEDERDREMHSQNPRDVSEPNLSATFALVDQGNDLRSTFEHYTVNDLRRLAQDLQVDVSHCLQREEMIDLFLNAGITGSTDPAALLPAMFSSWSISQLRSAGSAISIDLSQCATGDEMVEKILHAGNVERPYLRDYLRSLIPLTTTSLKDLRAIARELQIDISDCLEKGEIIKRLISRQRRQDSN